jgi:hypothetical protein
VLGLAQGPRGIDDAREVAQGSHPIRKLFSKQQGRSTASTPRGIGLDDPSVLGPITVLKLKFSVAEYDRSVVAEMVVHPDGTDPGAVRQVVAQPGIPGRRRVQGVLAGRGINLSGKPQTKTSTALRYSPVSWRAPRPEPRGSGRSAAQQRLCLAFALAARFIKPPSHQL